MALLLTVLIGAILAFRGLGALRIRAFGTWRAATRTAMAAMLCFTGGAHFMVGVREDLIRMVPPQVPFPEMAVFVTGLLEILGGIGLLIPRTRQLAGLALILFLIAVFPANIHAANAGLTVRGHPAPELWLRGLFQLLLMGLLWWSTRTTRSALQQPPSTV